MIRYVHDTLPTQAALDTLFTDAWGAPAPGYALQVLSRSLAYVGAYDGERLVGFVNVAWDGGAHAFILDTSVMKTHRRKGIASEMVRIATRLAGERGAQWLHVDFEPHLEGFYRACGFQPTAAGLIALKKA